MKHINLIQQQVTIVQAVRFEKNQPVIKSPKTKGSVRTISINPGFPYQLIENTDPEAFVLGGDSPWTETKYKRTMERIEKTINLHGATAHILRHTFATLAIGKGMDLKTVQGLLGHSTANTTMNIYAHVQKDRLLQASKQIGDIYKPSM